MNQASQASSPDFRVLFESAPGLYLVLTPDPAFTIVAVSDAYLRATMTRRDQILQRGIFEVFPDNPADPQATGTENLRASLERARDERTPDTMPVQKYDIRRPEAEGSGFEERYWSPVNCPVCDDDGTVRYIIHRVEDVTEFVRLKQQRSEQSRLSDELRARAEQMESEIFQRAQDLARANQDLRAERETSLREAYARMQAQLARLDLLHRITRAIGERQDLASIYQVIVHNLEDSLPVDLACIATCEPDSGQWTGATLGAKARASLPEFNLSGASALPGGSDLSILGRRELTYIADTSAVRDEEAWLRILRKGGFAALVIAPLAVERGQLGALIVARRAGERFSSGECEFLSQLAEHVALAIQQAELYRSLRAAYEDLRLTQRALLQQERLRALGQMASGIAHDINNAIMPISLYTSLLIEQGAALPQEVRGYLPLIQQAIESVGRTVERMRGFYRTREHDSPPVSIQLRKLVTEVVQLTRARWHSLPQQRGLVIDLKTVLEDNTPAIVGSEHDIRDALTNLIFNAVDAMPAGGQLTIRTAVIEEKIAAAQASTRSVVLEVTDTGVGMDPETRARCLEPFFTTKGEQGSGLGLAMVYGMAQRHDAELEITSEPGQGTTFRIRFVALAAGSAVVASPPVTPVMVSGLNVLVIDDDAVVIDALRATLQADGHTVTAASGGEQGIDAFLAARTRGSEFDAVITDLGMPYVDGRQVARAIKGVSLTTPVILLTGWGQRALADPAQSEHIDRILGKPPKLGELRAALAQLAVGSAQLRLPSATHT
jgi:signal transduction histidine kinase/ActR/RegA family two-component response regulator